MREVFIIGSKGIPARYGGFETFVENLTAKRKSDKIRYHISCLANNNEEFEHNGARCFNVNVPNIGPVKAIYYDIMALRKCIEYIKKNNIENAIVYILACRIGPFIGFYKQKLKKLGASLLVNPDGHEWKRGKWNAVIKRYWKISERLMVKHSNLLVCDSINIEKYIREDYKKFNPKTIYIAYGAEVENNKDNNEDLNNNEWFIKNKIRKNEYYLVVGRFVPENNYELMLKEFMQSNTKKDFVIVTNIEKNKFYDRLIENTDFQKDSRIKFVGTVYDKELLIDIRKNAYAYIHGHEVGGTNPSLLEALATTNLNLLLNVGFNKEVGKDGAIYFTKDQGNLRNLINNELSSKDIISMGEKAKARIREAYDWDNIVERYEGLLLTYEMKFEEESETIGTTVAT